MQGKIVKGIAGFYYVHDGHSKTYECKAKGIFRNKKIKPFVGDNVIIEVLDQVELKGNIIDILPRKNSLVRPAVANVDQCLVFFSALEPSPNFNLLDRFLIMMKRQELPVSICFNKTDLITAEQRGFLQDNYRNTGYPVYFTSTYQQEGITAIKKLLKGKTTVLAGPSGTGKSSITNILQPAAEMEIASLSKKIKRGKHTTRHSELFYVAENTFLMDTPGFSSMYIEDMRQEELKDFFPEFEKFRKNCRFSGCVHVGEPVCGIKDAVAGEEISALRYENYLILYQELKDKRRY